LAAKPCNHGKGVFARCRIQQGETVLRFSGPLLRRAELPGSRYAERDLYLQIGDDLFLGPSGDIDDFVNHSCDPNCGVVIAGGSVRLIAMRTIRSGEEIRFDYSTTSAGDPVEMRCSCGSPACRGRIGDFMWLPSHLQEKYIGLGVVPDYVLAELGEPVA
jgi:SET domain-containing protein